MIEPDHIHAANRLLLEASARDASRHGGRLGYVRVVGPEANNHPTAPARRRNDPEVLVVAFAVIGAAWFLKNL
jgi:hypothetical protein